MMADLHPLVVAQRRALSDVLDTLSAEQWEQPSWCDGWSTREVLAHLAYPATASKLGVFIAFAKSGFNLNKMTTATVRAERRSGPELVKQFRTTAEHRWTPPTFGFEAHLTDTVTHGSDMLRPLGLQNPIDPLAARAVLDFIVSKKATNGFVRKGRIDGLRFESTDLNWAFGDGPSVTGSSESLILAILGRTGALDDLTGPGVEILRSR